MQTTAKQYLSIRVVPAITANSAYASGNQVGAIQTLSGACLDINRFSLLESIQLIDADKQNANMTVFFFNQSPTLTSSDKSALAMTAANMKAQCIGFVTLTSYQSLSAEGIAVNNSPGLPLQSLIANGPLYAVAMTTGTPTYTSTSSLQFSYVLSRAF